MKFALDSKADLSILELYQSKRPPPAGGRFVFSRSHPPAGCLDFAACEDPALSPWRAVRRPPWRTLIPGAIVLAAFLFWRYPPWPPGLDVVDGRDDRGSNGIWLQHGWLADDDWFARNGKQDRIPQFRNPDRLRALAQLLSRHHITELFPHLCPTRPDGALPGTDPAQVERFLDVFAGARVLPWIGGTRSTQAFPEQADWRATFVRTAADLLRAHPRLAGVHLNIEPCETGAADFLRLLEELRVALPAGKRISVAAYPPPTALHPFPGVHWSQAYYAAVAERVDQLAVMMYDTALKEPYAYQRLMADWTVECLTWSGRTEVLLGLPAYDDVGVGYHHREAENLADALMGIHAGLARFDAPPANYRGVALYCEWEMDDEEWRRLREHFLRPPPSEPK